MRMINLLLLYICLKEWIECFNLIDILKSNYISLEKYIEYFRLNKIIDTNFKQDDGLNEITRFKLVPSSYL